VHLDGNQISDLTPLGSLNSLTMVDLKKNQVRDLAPVARLTAWRYLYLDHNQISDLGSLVAAMPKDDNAKRLWSERTLSVSGNPLSAPARSQQLPMLGKLLFDLIAAQ